MLYTLYFLTIIFFNSIQAQDQIIIYDTFGIPHLIFPDKKSPLTENKSSADESTQLPLCEKAPKSAAISNYLKDELSPKLDSIQKSLSDLYQRLDSCKDTVISDMLSTKKARNLRQVTTTTTTPMTKQPNALALSLTCDTQLPVGVPIRFTLNGRTYRNVRVIRRTSKLSLDDNQVDSNKTNQTGLYAIFGKDSGTLNLDYTNEISKRVDVTLLTSGELNNIKNLFRDLLAINNSTTQLKDLVEVDSDLLIAAQNIDSKNPSYMMVRRLENLKDFGKDVKMCLDPAIDSKMTRMSLSPTRLEIKCFGSPFGNSCGQCGLPLSNEFSGPVLLRTIRMDPTGPGASIPDDQWRRNQYILRGKQYSVYVKLLTCPT